MSTRIPRLSRSRSTLIAGALTLLVTFSASVTTSEPAHAATSYLCTETACPNGAQWAAARKIDGKWASYWGQAGGHNCTNYVAWRLQSLGVASFLTRGNAEGWARMAAAAGITVDHSPSVGAIAQWDANAGGMTSAGHVAYVEAVSGDTVTISEDAWNGGAQTGPFRWRNITASTPSHYLHPVIGGGGVSGSFLHQVFGDTAGWHDMSTALQLVPGSQISTVDMGGTWPQVMAVESGSLHQIFANSSGWHDMDTGIAVSDGAAISAVNMGGTWPQVMTNDGGVLQQIYADSAGWHKASTGLTIGNNPISAVNMGGTWPQVMLVNSSTVWQIWGDTQGWHIATTGMTNAYSSITSVNMGTPWPVSFLNVGGALWSVWGDSNGWHSMSTGQSAGNGSISAVNQGGTSPIVMTTRDGVLWETYGDTAWHSASTGLTVGSGPISAVNKGGAWPQVMVLE
ncbi:hypothetical protein Cch01nite_39810 [Cellulomonas chitinilytica]|uniref:Peptidase C51 domain-containing protein n=1 Tax=Cellulomonas chitinilytica TaxID=398759 RepID=A0A919U4A4_9CELL|nr:CHAP domain-containing protein [Cellulomonas chitinilytica]GIG23257.1 hypothetical protein Cch01nite_39810 [Cellulomonas chitinilytica]